MNKYSKFNRFFQKNSPTILTIIGSAGVVVTAIMSARDTVKAMKRIRFAEDMNRIEYIDAVEKCPLTKKQKIKVAAPCYIPTIITGLTTIACVVSSNVLNKNAQKSLTSAYMLLDRTYKEYKNSVKEVYGEEGNKNVIRHIADKKAEELNMSEEANTETFFDFFSLQFFQSTPEKIREAEAAANEMMKMHGYFSLATWYSFIGADMNAADEMLGWSLGAGKMYGYDRIRIDFDKSQDKDGNEFYIIDFADIPTENYLDI